jgi:NAD(P)-dependent dehydrogenase (short-subunit alcohol dehydrogenase family)
VPRVEPDLQALRVEERLIRSRSAMQGVLPLGDDGTVPARDPMGRMATPQEVANAAFFPASPASGFTAGVNLVVDGAITARVNY